MVAGDERYERLEHQTRFLRARGLVSTEMVELTQQLWLLERLAGKDATELDPYVVDRIRGDLEEAAIRQLESTRLLDTWLDAWEAGDEAAAAATQQIPAPGAPANPAEPIPRDGPAERADQDLHERVERNLQLLARRMAGGRAHAGPTPATHAE